jgi:hypothetical protein
MHPADFTALNLFKLSSVSRLILPNILSADLFTSEIQPQRSTFSSAHQYSEGSTTQSTRCSSTITMSWGMQLSPGVMKDKLQLDLTNIFNLQSLYRNFKMHLQLHPIEIKGNLTASTTQVSSEKRSVYNITGIYKWTAEDEKRRTAKRLRESLIRSLPTTPLSSLSPNSMPNVPKMIRITLRIART